MDEKEMVIIVFYKGKLVKVLDTEGWTDMRAYKDHFKKWLDDALPDE